MDFKQVKQKYHTDTALKQGLSIAIDTLTEEILGLQQRYDNSLKARVVFQEVARLTQVNIEQHLSQTVTFALKSVSEKFPSFVVKFTSKRNQTECDFFFEENGSLQDPMRSSGGGALDIASFGLRTAVFFLDPKRRTFLLDEPFRNASSNYHENISNMLKMMCEKLDLQIIMNSHAQDINIAADKTFLVTKEDGVSKVKEL